MLYHYYLRFIVTRPRSKFTFTASLSSTCLGFLKSSPVAYLLVLFHSREVRSCCYSTLLQVGKLCSWSNSVKSGPVSVHSCLAGSFLVRDPLQLLYKELAERLFNSNV